MLIALTGAHGQLGTAITPHLLAAGHHIRAIDLTTPATPHPDLTTITADVTHHDQLSAALHGTDALVHLAGLPNPHTAPGHQVHHTNVVGTYNALTAAVDHGLTHLCLASSINALGGAFSRQAHYDYFPVDETHPTHNEDPYSLSKWLNEAQADSIARRHPHLTIASFRIHAAVPDRDFAIGHLHHTNPTTQANHLWGYTRHDAIADAINRTLHTSWHGHEIFNLTAPDTVLDTDSTELAEQWWPHVPRRTQFTGNASFYDCHKAGRLLDWTHP